MINELVLCPPGAGFIQKDHVRCAYAVYACVCVFVANTHFGNQAVGKGPERIPLEIQIASGLGHSKANVQQYSSIILLAWYLSILYHHEGWQASCKNKIPVDGGKNPEERDRGKQ